MKHSVISWALLVTVMFASLGCGGDSDGSPTPTVDASTDATSPAVDAAVDAPADASADAPADASTVCIPTAAVESCNRTDDDCNGLVDDLDVGDDGIYDCLSIALVGNAGAYGSSNFVAWLETQGTSVARIGTDTAALTRAQLDAYDVVILDRLVRSYTQQEADHLAAWVSAGGGLIAMSGYSGGAQDTEFPNSLLAPVGLSFVGGVRSGPVTDFIEHPTTTGLESVIFYGGFAVAATDDAAIAIAIANLPGEPAAHAAMVIEHGSGRALVWGDEWIEFDSEWSSGTMIPALWANWLGWVARFR